MSKKAAVVAAMNGYEGAFHPTDIVSLSGASIPYVNNIINGKHAAGELIQVKEGRKTKYRKNAEYEGEPDTQAVEAKEQPPVADRFEYIRIFADMVIEGTVPSLLLTGIAGVGKTHIILNSLEEAELVAGVDYRVIKGHSSPLGLYQLLSDYRDELLIFDDCDSIWKDQTAVNILKAALDSYNTRKVTWNSRLTAGENAQIEPEFEFTGRIIFISNIDASKLDDAVVTRTITANLTMNNAEILEHIRNIAVHLEPNVSLKHKLEVLDHLDTIQNKLRGLSIRTFLQASRIRSTGSDKWKNMTEWVS